jgi:hypothetical protein
VQSKRRRGWTTEADVRQKDYRGEQDSMPAFLPLPPALDRRGDKNLMQRLFSFSSSFLTRSAPRLDLGFFRQKRVSVNLPKLNFDLDSLNFDARTDSTAEKIG